MPTLENRIRSASANGLEALPGTLGSAVSTKIERGEMLSTLIDVLRYYPRGLRGASIETPEGVRLDLKGLSPVTIGRYRAGAAEPWEREVLRALPENRPIIELGAGTGYLTTLVNRTTDRTHVAVEPNPHIFPILEETRRLNDADFTPVNAAYHPTEDTVEYPATKFFKTATFDTDVDADTSTLRTVSLEGLVREFGIERPLLHCDIEGAERLLFENEFGYLTDHCSGLLIEFHVDRYPDSREYIARLSDRFDQLGRSGPPTHPVFLFDDRP
jgi:FkbM family methyltransferase